MLSQNIMIVYVVLNIEYKTIQYNLFATGKIIYNLTIDIYLYMWRGDLMKTQGLSSEVTSFTRYKVGMPV